MRKNTPNETQKEQEESINHLTVIGTEVQNDDDEGSYRSQSALDHALEMDEQSVTRHHIAKFLNIVKTSDIFEGGLGYSQDLSGKLSKLGSRYSRKTTSSYCMNGVNVSEIDLSETLDTDSDTDDTQTSDDYISHLGVNDEQCKDSH